MPFIVLCMHQAVLLFIHLMDSNEFQEGDPFYLFLHVIIRKAFNEPN